MYQDRSSHVAYCSASFDAPHFGFPPLNANMPLTDGLETTKDQFVSPLPYSLVNFPYVHPVKQDSMMYTTDEFNSTASSSPDLQSTSQVFLSSLTSSPCSIDSSTFDDSFDFFPAPPVLQHHHHQHRQSVPNLSFFYPPPQHHHPHHHHQQQQQQQQQAQHNLNFYCTQPPAQQQPSLASSVSQPCRPLPTRQVQSADIRPYPCHMCSRAFARKHDLQRHIRVHTGAKPYSCLCCKKSFARTDALKRHLRMEEACRTSPEVQAMKGAGKRRYKNL
ncbi:hypothetical protein DFQ30_004777 [Apophysomyces sp. BC1015]|nr:hypothetical protein DFQ30_004777 [Apophysomyces sp. BC1015]